MLKDSKTDSYKPEPLFLSEKFANVALVYLSAFGREPWKDPLTCEIDGENYDLTGKGFWESPELESLLTQGKILAYPEGEDGKQRLLFARDDFRPIAKRLHLPDPTENQHVVIEAWYPPAAVIDNYNDERVENPRYYCVVRHKSANGGSEITRLTPGENIKGEINTIGRVYWVDGDEEARALELKPEINHFTTDEAWDRISKVITAIPDSDELLFFADIATRKEAESISSLGVILKMLSFVKNDTKIFPPQHVCGFALSSIKTGTSRFWDFLLKTLSKGSPVQYEKKSVEWEKDGVPYVFWMYSRKG